MNADKFIAEGHNDARTGNTVSIYPKASKEQDAWMVGFNGYYAGRSVEALQRDAAFASCPDDDGYAGLPNEDGINEDGQNVFCPGPY